MTRKEPRRTGGGGPVLNRRDFFKLSGLVSAGAFLGPKLLSLLESAATDISQESAQAYPLVQPENIINTVCLQCNTGCGIKAKILDGVLAKIDGNPYSPWTMTPHLDYTFPLRDAAKIEGTLCPKGQAGIQTLYDPYRIVKVLKRVGKRGENKWKTIPFETAISEVVNGGYLFKDVPGEENRFVEGLAQTWAVRDPVLLADLSTDSALVQKKQMTVDEFKTKHSAHLDKMIDPDHPDFGPKNNQFIFVWGRLKAGRSEFISRFVKDSFGSANAHGHTTVCQGSLYFTCKALSEQYDRASGQWTNGRKFYWQADTANSEFIIFVGASPFEANYGPPLRAGKITHGLVEGKLKIAVVDPRLSKTAAKAWKWLPARPGTEAALALAMIKSIIEGQRFDSQFLTNANKAAASADAEPSWTNASWLVKIDADGHPAGLLRATEVGLSSEDLFVVSKGGILQALDPYDGVNAVEGDVMVDTTIQPENIRVKSGLQLVYEAAAEHTIEEWAGICGVKASDIELLALEFTGHGKKAAADIHRGVSQHTNGFYNVLTWMTLNLLIGNFDWKGGMVKATTYDHTGSKPNQPFNFATLHPARMKPYGISIIRHETKYEDSTLFTGYPAQRQWYPLSSDIYQEILPSVGDNYPYPIKSLFLYMGTPLYSNPAGHTGIEPLRDTAKVPLFVAIDITVGETSMYADYIFPDLTYMERWEFHGSHPSIPQKVQPIRQPAVAPLTDPVSVFGSEMPLSLETFLLGLAEEMQLPGYGPDGFGPGIPFTHQDHFYLRMVANIAAGDQAGDEAPDASGDEVQLFQSARRYLPSSVFDVSRWQSIVGALWPKVVFVLNRGGRFQNYDDAYAGDRVTNKYATLINMFQEKTSKVKNALTGEKYLGYAKYLPAPADFRGNSISEDPSYPFRLITYREISHTKSRTIADYWLLAIRPENLVLINRVDAARLGLSNGDHVRVVSKSNTKGVWDLGNGDIIQIVGKVKVIEGIRPGVVAFSLGHGHWAYGSRDIQVDGVTVNGDERRRKGLHANAVMMTDPVLANTPLTDVVGGSAVFYDTNVNLIKQ